MMFSNPLIREVRSFYHAEYLIGEYAIAMIERDLGVKLPVDEAASIALHIVNAEYDAPMGDTIKITNQNELQALFEAQYHLNTEGRTETVTETRNVRVGESLGQVVTSGYCN